MTAPTSFGSEPIPPRPFTSFCGGGDYAPFIKRLWEAGIEVVGESRTPLSLAEHLEWERGIEAPGVVGESVLDKYVHYLLYLHPNLGGVSTADEEGRVWKACRRYDYVFFLDSGRPGDLFGVAVRGYLMKWNIHYLRVRPGEEGRVVLQLKREFKR